MEQNTIYKSLVQIQKEVSGVKKDSKGYNYNYESLDSIIMLLHPHLSKAGLGICHEVTSGSDNDYWCVTTVFDSEGQTCSSRCPIIDPKAILAKGNAMQGMGSAITYARRYNIKNIFNLFSTDDDAAILTTKNASDSQVSQIVDMIAVLKDSEGVSFREEDFYKFLGTQDIHTISQDKAKQAITLLKAKIK